MESKRDPGPPPGYVQATGGQQPILQAPPGHLSQQGLPMTAQPAGLPGHPQPAQWMPVPVQPTPDCPPGLEYLAQLDQLLVHQQIELLEVFTSWETANRYFVKNSLGQQVYYAYEESGTCERQCCGPQRGFIMHVTDNLNQEVMRITREFKCCAGCNWWACCCPMEVAVEAPVGHIVGYVRQTFSTWTAHYDILDAKENEVLRIRGPCCHCQTICCTDDVDFDIMDERLTSKLGKISKQWGGFVREAYTNADNFGVTFPMDLNVKTKATILGAVFLIDFMYFEQKQNNRR